LLIQADAKTSAAQPTTVQTALDGLLTSVNKLVDSHVTRIAQGFSTAESMRRSYSIAQGFEAALQSIDLAISAAGTAMDATNLPRG